MNTNSFVTTLLAASFLAASVHADVLPPLQDTSSLNGKITLATGKAPTIPITAKRKGYVLFNLNSIPPSVLPAEITNARLRVYFPAAARPGDIAIHKVTALWDEKTAAVEPAIDPAPIAMFPTASVVAKQFLEVDITATVQAWRTTPATNNGLAFVATGLTNVLLGAKEGAGTGYPCELEVEVDQNTADVALALPGLKTAASNNGAQFLSFNIIGGSTVNAVANGVTGVVIAGGGATNGFPQQINANYASIGGGYSNTIGANGAQSVIGGGAGNSATSSYVTVGGGSSNTGSGPNATVGGGNANTASGNSSTVPGGASNTASGTGSFAAGTRAKAIHNGAFVWGDSTNADVSSTANDQMTLRASGGVVVNTSTMQLNAAGGLALGTNATNATSVPVGTVYRDNTVVAWGRVSGNGTITDAFNVASVVRNSAGNYTVTMNTAFSGTALVPVVSVSYIGTQPTTAAAVRIASTNQLLSNTSFNVFINSGTFVAADADFTFIVTGR